MSSLVDGPAVESAPSDDAPAQAVRAKGKAHRAAQRTAGKRSWIASIGLHATLILASLIALGPIVWIFVSSFKPAQWVNSSDLSLVKEPTLANYTYVLGHTSFPRWVLNSVLVAAFTMAIGVFLSATTGYALSRFRFPGRRGLMLVFLVTQMFPVSILIVPIYIIMARLSLIDSLGSLVLAYLTIAVPFCAWMLRGYFDTIDTSLDEAAQLDGCGYFATFWRIVLPLARPGLAVTAFFTFLTAWGEIAYASAFIQTDSHLTLGYGLQQFVPRFNPQWHYLTAAAVLITIPAAVVYFFAQRHLVSGLTAGGTKG
jgi:arabinogalactan oligomer/maltooligosaccharide transport system permease protein